MKEKENPDKQLKMEFFLEESGLSFDSYPKMWSPHRMESCFPQISYYQISPCDDYTMPLSPLWNYCYKPPDCNVEGLEARSSAVEAVMDVLKDDQVSVVEVYGMAGDGKTTTFRKHRKMEVEVSSESIQGIKRVLILDDLHSSVLCQNFTSGCYGLHLQLASGSLMWREARNQVVNMIRVVSITWKEARLLPVIQLESLNKVTDQYLTVGEYSGLIFTRNFEKLVTVKSEPETSTPRREIRFSISYKQTLAQLYLSKRLLVAEFDAVSKGLIFTSQRMTLGSITRVKANKRKCSFSLENLQLDPGKQFDEDADSFDVGTSSLKRVCQQHKNHQICNSTEEECLGRNECIAGDEGVLGQESSLSPDLLPASVICISKASSSNECNVVSPFQCMLQPVIMNQSANLLAPAQHISEFCSEEPTIVHDVFPCKITMEGMKSVAVDGVGNDAIQDGGKPASAGPKFDATAMSGKQKEKKTSPTKRGRSEKSISLSDLQRHLGKSTREEAAKGLGVSVSTVKRICRDNGISRWPSCLIYKNRSSCSGEEDGHASLNSGKVTLACTSPCEHAKQKMNMVTMKAEYGDFIIKFNFSSSSKVKNLEDEVVKRLKLQGGTFNLNYQDEDGEWILISCEEDLQLCLSRSEPRTKVRLLVKSSSSSVTEKPAELLAQKERKRKGNLSRRYNRLMKRAELVA